MSEGQPSVTKPSAKAAVRPKPRLAKSRSARKWWARQAAESTPLRYAGWGVVSMMWVLTLPIAYFSWWILGSMLADWANQNFWRWVPALFPAILLFCVPIWWGMVARWLTALMVDVSVEIEAIEVAEVRAHVRETEEDALKRLEKTDDAGLLPLLRYSRAQLDAYYDIGLEQTRRSFFNAVTAMWLGFMMLIIGVALYIGPVERLGLPRPNADFNVLILSSAAIVEFISALFLWVYRSTIGQLTFYYRLQMHSHSSILAFRMANSMESMDEAKRAIIDSVLDSSLMPERPAPVANRIRALAQTARP